MKAVFIDKDGTLVKDFPYNINPRQIEFEKFVIDSLKRLQQDHKLIIISNQSGIAKGYFTMQELENYFGELIDMLGKEGISIDGYYYCPHNAIIENDDAVKACECRKPAPGLFLRAAKDHEIELATSWMIGDILNDIEAGHRAGCKSILVDNGNETEWKEGTERIPDFIAKDFREACNFILEGKASNNERLEKM